MVNQIDLRDYEPLLDKTYLPRWLSSRDGVWVKYRLDESVQLPFGAFDLDLVMFDNELIIDDEPVSAVRWEPVLRLHHLQDHDVQNLLLAKRELGFKPLLFDRRVGGYCAPNYSYTAHRSNTWRWIWVLDLSDWSEFFDNCPDNRKMLEEISDYFSRYYYRMTFSETEREVDPSSEWRRLMPVKAGVCCVVEVKLSFGIPEYHNSKSPVVRIRAYEIEREKIFG